MSSYEAEMAQYDKQWAEDQENAGGGLLPAGFYDRCQVVESRVEASQYGGWTFKLTYKNLGERGGIRSFFGNLDTEVGRRIAAEQAAALGWKGLLSQLNKACAQGVFDDLIVSIEVVEKVKETKVYLTPYVRKLWGRAEDLVEDQARAADDIPF